MYILYYEKLKPFKFALFCLQLSMKKAVLNFDSLLK